jgi:hypothetical protein
MYFLGSCNASVTILSGAAIIIVRLVVGYAYVQPTSSLVVLTILSPPAGAIITRKASRASLGVKRTRKAYRPKLKNNKKGEEIRGKKRGVTDVTDDFGKVLKKIKMKKFSQSPPQICYIRYNLLLFQE